MSCRSLGSKTVYRFMENFTKNIEVLTSIPIVLNTIVDIKCIRSFQKIW